MSMYKFVKGSRLFMQGSRDRGDYDGIHDAFSPTASGSDSDARARGGVIRSHGAGAMGASSADDELRAVHTMRTMHVDGTTEWEKSGRTVRKGGVKTRTSRTVRKVTTVTRGEQSVTSESVMRYNSDNSQMFPAPAAIESKKSLKFRVVDKVTCVRHHCPRFSIKCLYLMVNNIKTRMTTLALMLVAVLFSF